MKNRSHTIDHTEDIKWIQQTIAGDTSAYDHLFIKYQHSIYSRCYRLLQTTFDAEDAVQEVFVRAYVNLHRYDQARSFQTWLLAIATNFCLDQLKSSQRQITFWAELPPGEDAFTSKIIDAEEAVMTLQATEAIHDQINTLKSNYRIPLVLRYWYAMPIDEIAQTLDTTVNTVKGRLFRARRKLAYTIGPELNNVSE